jgi:hypothetical protein
MTNKAFMTALCLGDLQRFQMALALKVLLWEGLQFWKFSHPLQKSCYGPDSCSDLFLSSLQTVWVWDKTPNPCHIDIFTRFFYSSGLFFKMVKNTWTKGIKVPSGQGFAGETYIFNKFPCLPYKCQGRAECIDLLQAIPGFDSMRQPLQSATNSFMYEFWDLDAESVV